MGDQSDSNGVRVGLRVYGVFLAALGLVLGIGGAWLAFLRGPLDDLVMGCALILSGGLLCAGSRNGARLYLLFTLAWGAWSLWEVGVDGWALLPRMALILLFLALLGVLSPASSGRVEKWSALAVATAGLAGLAILTMHERALHESSVWEAGRAAVRHPLLGSDDWPAYGGPLAATRFEPATQLTPANVSRLEVAWTYRSGDLPPAGAIQESEATPLKVDRTLYFCTPHNVVIAVDAASGKERWRFDPHIDRHTLVLAVCRGVSYYKAPQSSVPPGPGECSERIIEGTLDFRLVALDAQTGRPCSSFGANGEVDLKAGFGNLAPNFVMVTSPPTIVGDLIVLGHMVMDNQRTDSPSGVVRAFDALTGELRWAWDTGRPGDTAPVPGRAYTLDTPNAWAVFAADADLGLVYIPTGGAPPDYYGGSRRDADEQFGSSIVALEIATGRVRWSFQTTHHDLWDYDLGAQPTLIDFPSPDGAVPALVQATKSGEIFVLDRRSGRPLTRVEERPAPAGAASGDHTAPTQPYSTDMPSVGGADLTDEDIWGLTPIDRMICSLQFHMSVYKGRYTPPSVKPFIAYPGFAGGVDWGGVAVDTDRNILIVNAIHFANRDRLVPRAEVERLGIHSLGEPGVFMPSVYPAAQLGTPFGVIALPWLSPLGLPCQRPPWGTITAIDLTSRQVMWTRPLGTTRDSGPWGIATHIAAPAGVPNQGGSVVTGGGLTFIGATLDAFLRAFDTRTGQELWRSRLPAGGQANPISYVLDGRQYVVVNAGGHGLLRTAPGDYLIAFALPGAQRP